MEQEFLDLIEDYKKNTSKVEAIRLYILKKLNNPEIIKMVDFFSDTAIEIKDKVGEALSYAMCFWLCSGTNLEYAYEMNNKAKKIYQSLPNYEEASGYLTTLNNELIYANCINDLKRAYYIATEAFRIAQKQKQISYYMAFSTNFAYILSELGLFEKAYNILSENDEMMEHFNLKSRVVSRRLRVVQLISLERYDEALKEINAVIELNLKDKSPFDTMIFYAEKLLIYSKTDDFDAAKLLYEDMIKRIDNYHASNRDTLYVSRSLGYYCYKSKNYDKALEYYEHVYNNLHSLLGCRVTSVIELSNVYEKLKMYDKALEFKNLALDMQAKSLKTVSEILTESKGMIETKFTDLAYRDMYQKTNLITSFLKSIYEELDINKIYSGLVSLFKELHHSYKFHLLISNTQNQLYEVVDNKITLVSLESFLNSEIKYNVIELNKKEQMVGFLLLEDKLYDALEFTPKTKAQFTDGLGSAIYNWKSFESVLDTSTHDNLTSLRNRQGLDQIILKLKNKQYYVLNLDIDDFKIVNDKYGHPNGDEALRFVGKTLMLKFGEEYSIRMGGEEFVVIYPFDSKKLELVLKEFYQIIRNKVFSFNNENVSITMSCGAALKKEDEKFSDAYLRADRLLYEAKNNGKNNYSIE